MLIFIISIILFFWWLHLLNEADKRREKLYKLEYDLYQSHRDNQRLTALYEALAALMRANGYKVPPLDDDNY